ncbi:MAG: FmdB family zinc ribbon protein [Candidatus Tumulicola sp.]
MPLYDYKCAQCGKVAEVRHGFNESYDARCSACGGNLARVFNAAPIVFKGSGFYVTDSRKAAAAAKSSSPEGAAKDAPAADKPVASKPDAPKAEPSAPSGEAKPATPKAADSAA